MLLSVLIAFPFDGKKDGFLREGDMKKASNYLSGDTEMKEKGEYSLFC